MLEPGQCFSKLPILVSPDKSFYTPIYKPEASLTTEVLACQAQVKGFCLQRVEVVSKGWLRRSVWKTTAYTETPLFLARWRILQGRTWRTLKPITPKEAWKLVRR